MYISLFSFHVSKLIIFQIGMEVLLLAWTGPATPVAKATIISTDCDTIVGGEPLGPATYEVIVNVAIKRDATLPYQYDDLRFVADAVTRSIAWPTSKVITNTMFCP